jgi:hypothetical protein
MASSSSTVFLCRRFANNFKVNPLSDVFTLVWGYCKHVIWVRIHVGTNLWVMSLYLSVCYNVLVKVIPPGRVWRSKFQMKCQFITDDAWRLVAMSTNDHPVMIVATVTNAVTMPQYKKTILICRFDPVA